MDRSLRPRSPAFRILLALALLAWTALPLDAFARPPAMGGAMGAGASTTIGKAPPSHCESMAMAHGPHESVPAHSHAAGGDHGCCTHGGCDCASLCSGIADVHYQAMGFRPARDPALSPVGIAPAPIHLVPPLRPPIA